ncbi:hypothetical protein EC973_006640 [Apophysomyces ossiformis]|uniref:Flavodoxin-like domain-containing protein n=1 Tax=Apophysomyces ossiformis TaxID=679940 RepID=A0A8H7BQW1_9FUNG|nr:hypothetical protein EC973_006640 [Apophysomyces ossiformis]
MAPKVHIIIYSMYHHVYTLSLSVKKGLQEAGVEAKIFQVPETLSDDILEKMHAPPKPDVPVISVEDLKTADGFLFGIPTRFGTMPAQMKAFLDATGQLWASGALAGKFVGTFFSTAGQHGGQETTAYTAITNFTHHGMNYVPLGFANELMFDTSEVTGSSPYGAGTITHGDGSRQPSEKELAIAVTQGKNFGQLLVIMGKGKQSEERLAEKVPAVKSRESIVIETEQRKSVSKTRQVKKEKTPSKCFCM